jgi:hypothetical protein
MQLTFMLCVQYFDEIYCQYKWPGGFVLIYIHNRWQSVSQCDVKKKPKDSHWELYSSAVFRRNLAPRGLKNVYLTISLTRKHVEGNN